MRKLIRNRRWGIVFLVCMCASVLCSAPSIKDSVLRYFRVVLSAPQEKIYLQLDKPSYAAGEDIWFKGYLVSAVSLREQDAFSNFIMVELVNREDSVVLSKKVKREDGRFYGNLKLDATLPAGDYYLRAYTNWMKNENPDFFYMRLIRIDNPIDTEITVRADYEGLDSEKLRAKIDVLQNGNPIARKVKLNYVVYAGENAMSKGNVVTDEKGHLNLDIPFDPKMKHQRIELAFVGDKYDYKTALFPYLKETEYSVTFFPEGGDLIPVPNQVVAFKAQGSNGYSLPVSGKVMKQSGEQVAEFTTMCDGMGAFNLSAAEGDRFYAEVVSQDGIQKRFDLPAVKPAGIKLVAKRTNGGIAYQVLKADNVPWPDTLYVVAHVRGLLRYMQVVNAELNSDFVKDEYLRDGIAHLILLNKEGKALSERLVFVKRAQQPELDLIADLPAYGLRERVKLSLQGKDYNGTPLSGDFAISVTDRELVPYDSLGGTIVSDLWLTSDLKGFVENPGRYFLPSNKRASAELNLVMLTHGWRRFNCSDFTQLPDTSFRYYVEQGLNFTGRVKPLSGSPAGMKVVGMAPSKGIMLMAETDSKGMFVMQGQDYPDSTKFTIRSRSARSDLPVTITMDPPDVFPAENNKIPYPDGVAIAELTEEALNAARDRYFAGGGIQIRNLEGVTVSAKKNQRKPSDPNYLYTKLSDRNYGEEFLEDRRHMTAWDIFQQLPGVTLSSGGDYLEFSSAPNKMPLLIINDVTYTDAQDYSMLQTYVGDEIERIDIVKNNAAALATMGARGANGAFVLTVRDVDKFEARDPENSVSFTPRGYNSSIEFYSPVYSTPTLKARSEPDLRTTIYWNPKISTDEAGTAQLEYYTNDRPNAQRIIIEGITTDGRPVRLVKELKANVQK